MIEHPTATVARDLAEIMRLAADLPEQAEHQANSRVMMGGAAMAEMAPVANLEAWAYRHDAAEKAALRGERSWPTLEHEDESDEPVLTTLCFWTEELRREMDAEWGTRPTIVSEANFLRFNIERVYDAEPRFDDLADDVSKARRKLENVLRAGERSVVGVPCLYDECRGQRIIRKMEPGRDKDGNKAWRQTDWFCPSCHRQWSEDQYARMVVAAAEAERYVVLDGHTWCSVERAAKDTGVKANTIRQWVSRKRVGVACVIAGRRKGFVSLDEVRDRHAEDKTRAA